MKVEHEIRMNRTKMSMTIGMCGIKLKDRNSEEIRELLGLEPVSLMVKKSRWSWSENVECKVSEKGLTSPSTCYTSFRTRVFLVNHLHWY